MELKLEGEEENRKQEEDCPLLVLNPPDRLNLGGLGMGSKFTVALVFSSVTVALQDVLVTTVTRVLVAHKAGTDEDRLIRLGG